MAELKDTHVERWVWLGHAPGKTASKVAVWRKPDGGRVAYASRPHTRGGAVGAVYECDVTDDGTWVGAPRYTGDSAADALGLQLDDEANRRTLGRAAAERKAKTNAELAGLLSRAEQAARGLTWDQRDQLIDLVRRAVYKAK